MTVLLDNFVCKICGSKNLVRYGGYKDKQHWFCKDCKHKFTDNDALPEMKTPSGIIVQALSMYYRGMSINDIRDHISQTYGLYPSHSTIYEWIKKYSQIAINEANKYTPKVGDKWIADETVIKLGGKNIWLHDLIDSDSRFLLATHISKSRTTKDSKGLVEEAARRAGKIPKTIITDYLPAYIDAIELAFGADTKHIQSKPFVDKDSTNIIERFHGTLKDRLDVMRGLKKIETANTVIDGWLFYYNFLRPHEYLSDKYAERTPAEAAGIRFPYRNWADIVQGNNWIARRFEPMTITRPVTFRVKPSRRVRKSGKALRGIIKPKITPRIKMIRR